MASNSSENLKYEKENLLTNSSPVLQEMRSSGKLCDIDIKVGEKTISAHRVILATVIPYFHTIICSAKENGVKSEIIMKEMNAEVIESLINFCYTGKIDVDPKNVGNLFICANLFELCDITDVCVKFMTKNIQMDNVIQLKNFGESNEIDELITAADKFICENFEKVSASEEFLTLSSSQLIDIIGRGDLKVSSEKEVYEAAMKWVKQSQRERLSVLPEVLKNVQLTSLPCDYLITEVSKETLIRQSFECRDILDAAKNELISMRKDLTPPIANTKSRQYTNEVIYVLSELDTGCKLYSILKYENSEWKTVAELTSSKFGFGAVSMNKNIYMIATSSILEIFNPLKNEWTQGASLIEKRTFADIAVLNGRIYVCGGYVGGSVSNSVECFTESQNTWAKVGLLIQARAYHSMLSLNGYLYAIGGYSVNSKSINSCERYCPKENKWTFVAPMKTSRYWCGAATLNGKIFVCGGSNASDADILNLCEVYDPQSDSWSSIAPMKEKRRELSLASCNGKLYAIGGYNGQNILSFVEEYCPEKNEWKFVTPLPGNTRKSNAITTSHYR